MKDGLRKLFYQYYSQHMQGTKKQLEREKLMAVIKKFPGQVLLTCASNSWTTDVLFALTQLEQLGQPNALRKCKQNYKKKVESYIELVEKPGISKVDRLKLVALIIIDEHNREIIERIHKTIDRGDKIVIWPSSIVEKDVNDMINSGQDVSKVIESNTYSGLKAKIKFNYWKKI
jgi:hypothetical protein